MRSFVLRALGVVAMMASLAACPLTPSIAATQLRYRLDPVSAHEEGCFGACLCPITMRSGVTGSFVAESLEPEGSYRVFAIRQVRWVVPSPDVLVRGSGTYRIDAASRLQRLVVDLQVGEDPAERYDSGIVPVQVEFPDLAVTISAHGMYCWDTVFDLKARVVPAPRLRADLDARTALPAEPVGAPGASAGAPLAVQDAPFVASTWSKIKALYREPSQ